MPALSHPADASRLEAGERAIAAFALSFGCAWPGSGEIVHWKTLGEESASTLLSCFLLLRNLASQFHARPQHPQSMQCSVQRVPLGTNQVAILT
jgi:hypothetical protein